MKVVAAGLLAALLLSASARGEDDEPAPVTPDLDFYKARVAPIVHGNCAECHADPRKRLGRHFLRPRPGRAAGERDHERNYRTLLLLLTPGNPARSTWLLKALGPGQGGVEHGGGARIRFDSLEYAAMVDFINGVKLQSPTATPSTPPPPPEIGDEGLTFGVDDLALEGDAAIDPGDGVRRWIGAGATGGSASVRFRLPVEGTWLVTFEVRGPGAGLSMKIDAGAERGVGPVDAGVHEIGVYGLLDGVQPFDAEGRIVLEGGHLSMRGRHDAPSAFLLPAEIRHTKVEASVVLPGEEDGGDDVLLLFDAQDRHNAKFAGLVDGGRKFVMGLVEGGRQRTVTSVPAPAAKAEGARRLAVELFDGVAVGRLDGKALAFLHLDRHLRERPGRFGVRTHGRLVVETVAAFQRWEVHRAAPRFAPAVRLRAGEHGLEIGLPPGAPALLSVTIKPLAE